MKKKEKTVFQIIRFRGKIETFLVSIDEFSSFSGDGSPKRVHEYNFHGFVAKLPDLNTGRRHHACGHYVHHGQIVSFRNWKNTL